MAPALRAHAPTGALAFGARRRLALQPPEPARIGTGRSAALAPEPGQVGAGSLMDEVGAQLAGWGTVLELETRGRVTGNRVSVAVGYLESADGSLLVAAGDPDADWARNLETDPLGQVKVGARSFAAAAERLEGREAADVVVALILKYGTSAERLGRGPVFRLRPVDLDERPGG